MNSDPTAQRSLIVKAGDAYCALPLLIVREVMRALPILSVKQAPQAVLGASTVRGLVLPVISLSALLNQGDGEQRYFVVLRTPGNDCVLAVNAFVSIASTGSIQWQQPNNLLGSNPAITQIAAVDGDLITALDAARVLDGITLPLEISR